MYNYCEDAVQEVNYLGAYTERSNELDDMTKDVRFMAIVNRSTHVIKTKSDKRISGKRNGRVTVINMYDSILSAEDFGALSDRQKLITIEEYKTRHGLINAAIHMGKKENWLFNQRTMALARLAEQGIDGKLVIAEHKNKHMKFSKEEAPKKVRHNRKESLVEAM